MEKYTPPHRKLQQSCNLNEVPDEVLERVEGGLACVGRVALAFAARRYHLRLRRRLALKRIGRALAQHWIEGSARAAIRACARNRPEGPSCLRVSVVVRASPEAARASLNSEVARCGWGGFGWPGVRDRLHGWRPPGLRWGPPIRPVLNVSHFGRICMECGRWALEEPWHPPGPEWETEDLETMCGGCRAWWHEQTRKAEGRAGWLKGRGAAHWQEGREGCGGAPLQPGDDCRERCGGGTS